MPGADRNLVEGDDGAGPLAFAGLRAGQAEAGRDDVVVGVPHRLVEPSLVAGSGQLGSRRQGELRCQFSGEGVQHLGEVFLGRLIGAGE